MPNAHDFAEEFTRPREIHTLSNRCRWARLIDQRILKLQFNKKQHPVNDV